MKRINILEIALVLIFIASGSGAIALGQDLHTYGSSYTSKFLIGGDSGLIGGAIALGIISATALFGIIWTEIERFKDKQS